MYILKNKEFICKYMLNTNVFSMHFIISALKYIFLDYNVEKSAFSKTYIVNLFLVKCKIKNLGQCK